MKRRSFFGALAALFAWPFAAKQTHRLTLTSGAPLVSATLPSIYNCRDIKSIDYITHDGQQGRWQRTDSGGWAITEGPDVWSKTC